jgi:hypothetical protein
MKPSLGERLKMVLFGTNERDSTWQVFLHICMLLSFSLLILSSTKFEWGSGLTRGLYPALIAMSAMFVGGFLGFFVWDPQSANNLGRRSAGRNR